ncbi:flagellar hook-associated protein FlgL [Marinicrinis sediminis]|uniref:Flagellar hook-associated protein FlgL n=1 Tax=Marinicrinis sediminis TaxID=1652465 RepID=A0ABW5RBA9_9BACL
MLRVTQSMMNTQLIRNVNKNLYKMDNYQNQVSTGRKINKPSDDPVGITYSLRYRSELAANEQYQKNVDSALSWLDFSDTVLGQAGDVMHRLKDLSIQAGTGTNPQVALDGIKEEIEQLKDQLIDIANSQINGKYVFNGQTYDQTPYNVQDPSFDAKLAVTDSGDVDFTIGLGVQVSVNMSGNEVFGNPGDADNIFKVLDDLITDLGSGNYAGIGSQIQHLDMRMEKILTYRSEVGARVNRVELMQNRLSELELNLMELKSKNEDAEYEELLINAKIAESVYQASLSVGAKIITPTLVDFLR